MIIRYIAHVKWFTEPTKIIDRLNFNEWIVVAIFVTFSLIVLRYISNQNYTAKLSKKLDKKYKHYREWVPLIVRVSTASFLITNLLSGYSIAPNILSDGAIYSISSALFTVTAIMLLLGVYTRTASVLMILGYLLMIAQNNPTSILEHFEYIAISLYLYTRGPGKYSLAGWRHKDNLSKIYTKYSNHSLKLYRIGIGLTLSILALSEKLINLSQSHDFLNSYHWNFLSSLGLEDRGFIILIGALELVVGMALILNLVPRAVVALILALMIVTASLLGVQEVYGHLFALGLFTAIWVNDSKKASYS